MLTNDFNTRYVCSLDAVVVQNLSYRNPQSFKSKSLAKAVVHMACKQRVIVVLNNEQSTEYWNYSSVHIVCIHVRFVCA